MTQSFSFFLKKRKEIGLYIDLIYLINAEEEKKKKKKKKKRRGVIY